MRIFAAARVLGEACTTAAERSVQRFVQRLRAVGRFTAHDPRRFVRGRRGAHFLVELQSVHAIGVRHCQRDRQRLEGQALERHQRLLVGVEQHEIKARRVASHDMRPQRRDRLRNIL